MLFVVGADLVIGHHHAAAHFGPHDALAQHVGLQGLAQLIHAHALLFQFGFELGAVQAAHLHHLGIETGTPQFGQRGLLQVEHGDDLAVDHRGNFVELGSLGRAGQAEPCHQDQKGRFFQGKFSRYAHRL